MTILVSVKINDGVVMATDSASSFSSGMVYNHSRKIVNLRECLPIGVMVTGGGGIGNESIDTLLKDLCCRFNDKDAAYAHWTLDPEHYSMQDIVSKVRQFLFEEKLKCMAPPPGPRSGCAAIPLCGFSHKSGKYR